MMDDLEQRLQAAPLAEPSAELDRRIDAALRAARETGPSGVVSAGPKWWLGAVAAGLSLAAGLLVSIHRAPPRPAPVVYHIEAEGRLRDMLLNPASAREALPQFSIPGGTQ